MVRIVGGGIGSSSGSIKIADRLEHSWRINGDIGADKLSEAQRILLASVGCQMLPHRNFPKDENVEFYRNMSWRKLNRDFHFSSASNFIQDTRQYLLMSVEKIVRFRIFWLLLRVLTLCERVYWNSTKPLAPVRNRFSSLTIRLWIQMDAAAFAIFINNRWA